MKKKRKKKKEKERVKGPFLSAYLILNGRRRLSKYKSLWKNQESSYVRHQL